MCGSRALVLSSLVTLSSAFVGCGTNATPHAGTGGIRDAGENTGHGGGGNTTTTASGDIRQRWREQRR